MSRNLRTAGRPVRSDPNRQARLRRDTGLDRVRSITRGVAVASVAGAVAIGVYLGRAIPGHTSTPAGTPTGTSGTGTTAGSSAQGGGYAGQSGQGVAPPANAPTPSYQQAPVVSGSS